MLVQLLCQIGSGASPAFRRLSPTEVLPLCNLLQIKRESNSLHDPIVAGQRLFLSQASLLLPAFYVYAFHDEPKHQGCFCAEAYDLGGDRYKVWEVGDEKDEPAHAGERHEYAQKVREKGRPVDQVADQQAIGSEEKQGTNGRRGWKSEVQSCQNTAGEAEARR